MSVESNFDKHQHLMEGTATSLHEFAHVTTVWRPSIFAFEHWCVSWAAFAAAQQAYLFVQRLTAILFLGWNMKGALVHIYIYTTYALVMVLGLADFYCKPLRMIDSQVYLPLITSQHHWVFASI